MSATEQLLRALRDAWGKTKLGASAPTDSTAELVTRLEQLKAAQTQLGTRVQGFAQTAASHVAEADHVAAQSRLLLARGRDLRSAAQPALEALENVRLAGLNASLEGSRLPEHEGKALLVLAEEVRDATARSGDALDELLGLLTLIDRDRETLRESSETARQGAVSLTEQAEAAVAAEAAAVRAHERLTEQLTRATGVDPELTRLLAQATEHARGLVTALRQLQARDATRFALRSLRPIIEPLVRLIGELYDQSSSGERD